MSKLTTQLQQARREIAEKEAESRAWEEEVTGLSQQLKEASSKLKVHRNTVHWVDVNCPALDCAPPSPTSLPLPPFPTSLLSLLFFLLNPSPCLPSSPSSFSSHPSCLPPLASPPLPPTSLLSFLPHTGEKQQTSSNNNHPAGSPVGVCHLQGHG